MSLSEPFARYRPLVEDWQAFEAALSRPLPVCAWTNTLRTTPEELERRLAGAGLSPVPLPWLPSAFRLPPGQSPGARLEFVAGLYHLQEEVSLLPPVLLDPRPGERIADLCAAPGGKTAQIAVALGNRGTVVANDRDVPRLTTVRATLDRLGVVNVSTTSFDGANYPPESGLFDRVLVDVPCTCEGTSRKNPEVLGQAGLGSSLRLSRVQRALLRKAVRLCRPGGRIVYSTCTYAPEENELVVAEVLEQEPGGSLRLLPARLPGLAGAPGVTLWEGKELPEEMRLALRIWPHLNDTGGFFVAVLEKSGGAAVLESSGGEDPGVEEAPPEAWQPFLAERFGLGPEVFSGYRIFRRSRRSMAIVTRDHRPPGRPSPYTVGMPFLHLGRTVPMLTTAAVMTFGPSAKRNVLATDRCQSDAYLRRRDVVPTADQEAGLTGPGQVLVRHGEIFLGLGLLRQVEGRSVVESLFPKRWLTVAPGEVFPGLEDEP